MVRRYRPRAEILNGHGNSPAAQRLALGHGRCSEHRVNACMFAWGIAVGKQTVQTSPARFRDWLEAHRRRSKRRVALKAILAVELLIVTQVENERRLVNNRRVAEARADCVDLPLDGAGERRGPGIVFELAIVIADNAENEALGNLTPNRPLPMIERALRSQ